MVVFFLFELNSYLLHGFVSFVTACIHMYAAKVKGRTLE